MLASRPTMPSDRRSTPLRTATTAVVTALALVAVSLTVPPASTASAAGLIDSPASLAAAFAAGGTVTLDASISVSATDPIAVPANTSVTLNLNGKKLVLQGAGTRAGLQVPDSAALTISDAVGGGELTATGGPSGAGIGGNQGSASGSISIASGTVTASTLYYAAGIGGGNGGANGKVKITGGTVKATGGLRSAAIGGGMNGAGGTVEITGGTVTATAGMSGAGIGGGELGAGGNITVSAGTVTASGGSRGAGIGGGTERSGGIVQISGGIVTAQGGDSAAGIGGGYMGAGETVAITGGTVFSTGGYAGAAIGGGFGQHGATVTIAGGANVTVAANTQSPMQSVFGGGNGISDFGSLSNAGVLTIGSGARLTVPAANTVQNGGVIRNLGTISLNGMINNSGRIITAQGAVNPATNVAGRSFAVTFNADPVAVPGLRVFASTLTDAEMSLPPAPTRLGYLFGGWFTAPTGGTAWGVGTTISGNTTVYGRWTADPRTVSFDAQGGSSVAAVVTNNGFVITAPTAPTRDGYRFLGWFTATTGGTAWNFDAPVTTNVTAFARWVETRSVTFDTQGGTVVDSVTTDVGTAIPAPSSPTRTGYRFLGWFTAASGGSACNFNAAVTANVTAYAQWVKVRTVTFDAQGGTAVAPVRTDTDVAIPEPGAPSRTGYAFGGWFTAPINGTAWMFTAPITADVTLYAGWTAEKRVVTFDAQGGSAVAAVSTDYDTPIEAPVVPKRTGYTFVGWFTAASGGTAWNFDASVRTDAMAFARWTADPRTVSFDARGGSAVAAVVTTYDAIIKAPTAPKRTGYTFAGWFTAASGGTAWKFTAPVTANVKVYAHWTGEKRTITFDARGGSAVATVATAYGAIIKAPAAPERSGYVFAGWFTKASGGTAWKFSAPVTANVKLYAHWLVKRTVTFDSRGGSAVAAVSTGSGKVIKAPAAPKRSGYVFAGWFTKASGGTAWKFSAPVTANVKLYAHWLVKRTVTFDSRGGSAVAAVSTGSGKVIKAPAAPKRSGYVFAGWFTAASGGTAWKFSAPVTANVKLYAHWTKQ
ncbi:InlB B-repeat-containing protein [Leifsonia kafniensis]